MHALTAVVVLAVSASLGKPPPAWITTSTGRHKLAHSSYCWMSGNTSVCADYRQPTCGDGTTPTIRVVRGERVRFEFGFNPSTVSLQVGKRKLVQLAKTRRPYWRATRSGPLFLFTKVHGRGDASYAACLVFRR